jgi:hypothetical protein
MNENNSNNHAPIFTFLNKHKWRVILPMIFAVFYFALPRYLTQYIAVQQNLFIKSSAYDKTQLKREVTAIQNIVLSDNFLQNLIVQYNMHDTKLNEVLDVEKLRTSIEVRIEDEEFIEGIGVYVWIHFKDANQKYIAEISKDVTAQFEKNQNFHLDKYVTKPYDAIVNRSFVFIGDIAFRGLFLFSIPLILFWEIPNIFYSPKTKETVFEPLKSDWQTELTNTKLRNHTWKTFEINFRYSTAFIFAMVQKSPLGELIEYVRKIAN